MSSSSTNNNNNTLTIETPDILRLMLAYLTSLGLHESADALRNESGVGFLVSSSKTTNTKKALVNASSLPQHIRQGEWGIVSRIFSLQQNLDELQIKIQAQVVLELAENHNDDDASMELAYSVFRVLREEFESVLEEEEDGKEENGDKDKKTTKKSSSSSPRISLARSLEQKLAALTADPIKYKDIVKRRQVLYGNNNNNNSPTSRQDRRNQLAKQFEYQQYTNLDLNRLPTLLQQAIQWQSHTGQLPYIQEILRNDSNGGDESQNPNKKRKKSKKSKVFDLLMGTNAAIENAGVVGEELLDDDEDDEEDEPIPESVHHKIKFGKSAVCETATFINNNSNTLITGSSDGLIELWKGNELNIHEYPYQDDSVMGHNDAVLSLQVSNDGTLLVSGDVKGYIKVWKVATGKCLRQYQVQASGEAAVTCLALTRDASRVLTGSSSGHVKEFGTVSQTLLQEYIGHTSYVQSCQYVMDTNDAILWVVTGSADGTVRIWQKGDCQRILQPPMLNDKRPVSSLVIPQTQLLTESPAISNVFLLPAKNYLLLVPRSSKAYLVDLQGTLIQTYTAEHNPEETIFCAACVTATWLYIATQKGDCLVFSLTKGTLQTTIRDFALDSTYSSKSSSEVPPELTQLVAHPFKPTLAAMSNDKTQKRGVLTVWK